MKNSTNKTWLFWTTLNHIVGPHWTILYILDSFGPFQTILFVSLVPNYHMYLLTFHSEKHLFWDTLYSKLPSSWHFWGGQFWYSPIKDKRRDFGNKMLHMVVRRSWNERLDGIWQIWTLGGARFQLTSLLLLFSANWMVIGYLGRIKYSNVGRLFCTPAPPKFTKKLAVDSFFNFGSWSKQK